MSNIGVKGKVFVQVYISADVEEARKRYVTDTYGPNITMKTEIYQQAMVEFLKSKGYWANGAATQLEGAKTS